MRKPTASELQNALDTAAKMRATKKDTDLLAKSLLYLDERVTYLEKVRKAAELYLFTGLGEHEHSVLVRAIEAADRADERAAAEEHTDFGLE